MPQYMEKFKCIGSDCEDTCCAGWGITIDKKAYKKYKKCSQSELKKEFDKNIVRNRKEPTDYSYAQFKLTEEGRCTFLTQDGWCNIHAKLGEEYLCNTCTGYPRKYSMVNGVIEKSGETSCPEVVRLALLNPAKMEFEQVEEEIDLEKVHGKIVNTNNHSCKNKEQKYFWELRIFTIQVLQAREYELWERLIILGNFYHGIEEIIQKNKIEEIPMLIEEYIEGIEKGIFDTLLEEIPVNENIQIELLKEIMNKRTKKGFSNKRFIECHNEFVQELKQNDENEIIKHYKEAYELYYHPYMNKQEYILENYLVNYVFRLLFPFSKNKSLFEEYTLMIIHYALIKMYLVGMAAFHKNAFCTEYVVKLIQSFSKVVEHDQAFLGEIMEFLKENKYLTLTYLLLLIKN